MVKIWLFILRAAARLSHWLQYIRTIRRMNVCLFKQSRGRISANFCRVVGFQFSSCNSVVVLCAPDTSCYLISLLSRDLPVIEESSNSKCESSDSVWPLLSSKRRLWASSGPIPSHEENNGDSGTRTTHHAPADPWIISIPVVASYWHWRWECTAASLTKV